MYTLKQIPEDFIVNEVTNVNFEGEGKFLYFKLKKKNHNTLDALRKIAKEVRVPLSWLGIAGNKDKQAITTQYCSIKQVAKEKLDGVKLEDIDIKIMGRGDEPISLGSLKGNEFEIVLRNVHKKPEPKIKVVNYFGEQRFGRNNVEVGRALIKKDFKKAAELLEIESRRPIEDLIAMNNRTLRIYIHAYQSYIWNKTVDKLIEKGIEVKTVPIVGFSTIFENEDVKKIIKEIMKEENLTKRDFIIRQLPELSAEGDDRNMYINVENLNISDLEDDELNENSKKLKLKFFLPKGCYATSFIRQLMD